MSSSSLCLEKLQRYLKAIEQGDREAVQDLFVPHATIEQLPNRIYPKGICSTADKIGEAFEKGRKLLASQSYEIKNHLVEGDRVSLEVLWTGKLAIAFGNLAAGYEMRAHSAMFFQFENGRIVRQRNYDCFEPW